MKNNRKTGEFQRAAVYIDGYNLYHGLIDAFGGRHKWLDVQALGLSFLQPGMSLVSVKYFTAITKSVSDAKLRQAVYLKSIDAHCDKLEIIYGRFMSKTRICKTCGARHAVYEEKKTDVNIACHLLNDAHQDIYDCCYIVSGDSDLVPALQIIQANNPHKKTFVVNPPKRKSSELCKTANDAGGWFSINRQRIKSCQLPEKITTKHGNELTMPATWQT